MEKAKTKKLSTRMTIYCVIFAGLLSVIIGGLGFYTYYTNSVKHYEQYIRSILHIAEDLVDKEDMKQNIRTGEISKKYEETQERINSIKNNSDIEYIYIIDQNETGQFEYILCGYSQEELDGNMIINQFGDSVGDDFGPVMKEEFAAIIQGKSEGNYIPNTWDSEFVMTGGIPIKEESGEIIAVIGVDIRMGDIIDDLKGYVVIVLIGTIILVTIFLFFFLNTIKKKIVKPIITMGAHASEFVNQTKSKPSEMVVNEVKVSTGDEIELLSDQMNNMMKDIVEYMTSLESVTAVQERFSVQLDLAKQIQQNMLPCVFPAFPERTEFDIYAIMHTAKIVGKGFYDFFMIDGTHLGFIVAEVSGGGVPAALFMMIAKTLIKNYAVLGLEPAKVFMEANNELCENNDAEMTVTAFMGILDVYNGDFTYVSAGEHTPYIKKKGQGFTGFQVKHGFLLGALEKAPFKQEAIKLEKGDILCLFTNGILNTMNETGEKFNLVSCLNQASEKMEGLDSLLNAVKSDVELFMENSEQKEDITIMAIKFEGIESR